MAYFTHTLLANRKIMDTEALIKFLKENLKVIVTNDSDGDINVALILCEEEISRDWTSIPKSE